MRSGSDKSCWENKKNMLCSIPSRNSCRIWDNTEKYGTAGQTTDDDMCACALHAGYLRLQTHTHNMYYLLLFYSTYVCRNTPQCYVLRANCAPCSSSIRLQLNAGLNILALQVPNKTARSGGVKPCSLVDWHLTARHSTEGHGQTRWH